MNYDERATAELIRKRREMQRIYAANYAPPEPIEPFPSVEPVSFSPLSTWAQDEDRVRRDIRQHGIEDGFLCGMAAGGAIVMIVLPLTLWLVGALNK